MGPHRRVDSRAFPVRGPVGSAEVGGNGDQGAGRAGPVLPDWVARPLDALPGDQREVLRLRVVVGLSADQTATVLGSTADRVRILQHHALNQLRRALET